MMNLFWTKNTTDNLGAQDATCSFCLVKPEILTRKEITILSNAVSNSVQKLSETQTTDDFMKKTNMTMEN